MAVETGVKLPNIIPGPLTLEGKLRAVEEQSEKVVDDFLDISCPKRSWSIANLPADEIRKQGPLLSEDSVILLEGFMGIEEYAGDYSIAGLKEFTDRARRNLHMQWSAEEMRHGRALQFTLEQSYRKTRDETRNYIKRALEKHWEPSQHSGLDGSLAAIFFGDLQEGSTYMNYQRLRRHIREECGLPRHKTTDERKRRYEFGISEVISLISFDEIAHKGIYHKLGIIYLAYFPEEALSKIREICDGFSMPANDLIPNKRKFIRSLLRTSVYNADIHERVSKIPFLRSFNLTS